MKIDIKETVNLRKLDAAIEQYKNTIDFSYTTYLIMNSKTLLELECASGCERQKYTGATISLYRGIKVAICEALKFGEVEIK